MTREPLTHASIDRFQRSVAESGRSPRTSKAYATDLRMLLAWAAIDEVPLACFEQVVQVYLADIRGKVAPATLRRRLSAVREYAEWADLGQVLRRYKAPPMAKAVPHPLPEGLAGVTSLLSVARTPAERTLVALLGFEGLRVEEAVTQRADAVDMYDLTMTVFGKGERERTIPIIWLGRDPILLATAEAMVRRAGGPLIPRSNSWARATVRELGARAGLRRPVSSHDLRATFATALYAATKDLLVVQNFLGHADSKTTEIYTLVDLDAMRAGGAALTPEESATVLKLVTSNEEAA